MYERQELKRELKEELQWVIYRMRMLDVIEEKLLLMKEMTEWVKDGKCVADEVRAMNSEIKDLLKQVRALDDESRRMEDEKILRL